MTIKVDTTERERISQGDIFRDIEYVEHVSENEGIIEVSKIIYPLVIVLTQDCDLKQHHNVVISGEKENRNQDKLILSVLVVPIYNAEHVYTGEHLKGLDLTMSPINKTKSPGENLIRNQVPRYHYIEFPDDIPIVPSVIDFKHYFSVNVNYLGKLKKTQFKTQFICKVSELYREDISHRFASYLSRIGLPPSSRITEVK